MSLEQSAAVAPMLRGNAQPLNSRVGVGAAGALTGALAGGLRHWTNTSGGGWREFTLGALLYLLFGFLLGSILGRWVERLGSSGDPKSIRMARGLMALVGALAGWELFTALLPAGFVRTLDHQGFMNISSLAFSPNGRLLAVANIDHVSLWDTRTPALVPMRTLNIEENYGLKFVQNVVFSPDSLTLASISLENVELWNVRTGTTVRRMPLTHLSLPTFSPDGKFLAGITSPHSGSTHSMAAVDSEIALWNVSTGRLVRTLPGPQIRRILFSADSRLLFALNTQGLVTLWEVSTGRRLRSFAVGAQCSLMALSPDGVRLATGSKLLGPPGSHVRAVSSEIRLWEIATGKLCSGAPIRTRFRVNSLAFAPDGKTLVSGGGVEKYSEIMIGAPFGKGMTSAVGDRSLPQGASELKLWDVRTGALQTELGGPGQPNVESVAFSPDGATLASGGSGLVHLWNLHSFRLSRR